MYKKLIKNSQPFGKKISENRRGGFFLTRTVCMYMYVCRLLICNKRTYYRIEIHEIMTMQMNKKKEKNIFIHSFILFHRTQFI